MSLLFPCWFSILQPLHFEITRMNFIYFVNRGNEKEWIIFGASSNKSNKTTVQSFQSKCKYVFILYYENSQKYVFWNLQEIFNFVLSEKNNVLDSYFVKPLSLSKISVNLLLQKPNYQYCCILRLLFEIIYGIL